MTIKMDAAALTEFLKVVFPQVCDDFEVCDVRENFVEVALIVKEKHLRPGNTVSGPSMFGLADVAAYLGVLAMVGPKALAVTTNCSIDFMRKPEAGTNLIAKCEVLKLGRALAITQCLLYSEGNDKPAARANLTYSLPPAGSVADNFLK